MTPLNKHQLRLSAGTVALALSLAATPAFAQSTSLETEDDGGTIVVTGTRIASENLESPAPLQIIDQAAIDNSGVTNIQELLLENPVFGTPALSRTNSAFLTSGTGVASVDLRDLGSDRTLVLINGRRVVSGLPGSSTVDLNIIPTQFIERVDVLTGGASALYGSDAVAGVVNFIYRQDFEGIEANAQYGITDRGDDERYQVNLTAGTNVFDDRGNIMVHFGYSDEKGVRSSERRNTQLDDFDLFRVTGDPADFGTPSEPFLSSFPPQGRFDPGNGDTFTYSPSGQLQNCFTPNADTCTASIGPGIGPNGFNRQAFRTIAVPVERYLFAAAGDYEITDGVSFFFEGTYSSTSSSRIIEPFALSSEDIFPASGGLVPIEYFVPGDADGDGTITAGEQVLLVNPIVPDEIVDAAVDSDGDGFRDISFARRTVEFGPRMGGTTRDTYRFVLGLQGDFFDERFRWDASYNYGSTSENQFSSGQVNVLNFRNALAATRDVTDRDQDGLTDDIACVDGNAIAQGCTPINLFGIGSITPEAIDYINAESSFQTDITQQVVQANISGALFDLPGGSAGIALGGEYRKESSVEELDALTNAGLNAGNALPDTMGSFDVIEGFVEVKLPILADIPFFQLLEIGGALRVADYSTVGQVESYNGTVTWMPIEDIRLRGTYSRSVRAPNVSELFTGPSQTFPSGLTDPCEGASPTGTSAIDQNCFGAPGAAGAGLNANAGNNMGVVDFSQSDIQGISGFNIGNPDLGEETADVYTIGAVINPRSIYSLRNLSITVDYFNYSIDDVIASPPRQFVLDQCFGEGNDDFCQFITRRSLPTATNSAGSIEFIDAVLQNSAQLETDGIDVTANFSFPVNDGRVFLRGAYTHLFSYDFTIVPTADPDPQEGEIGTADHRFTANAGFSNDLFRVNFTGTYIGESTEDDQFCAAFGLDSGCFPQDAEFYLDGQATLFVGDEFEVYLGVDNILDNDAPNLLSGTSYNVTGTDTAADVYDVFGRRYYAGVRLKLR